ncbi:hypothetical protein L226DRAFT_615541 [Lentinus tigrinus ALCF2SS1-7]|uniref:Uncharacterized protein n=1 Tax=Lentinus tigrinus ALCF2SS1-6 TaxID=1328759 RepID=A0A5C2RQL9_9APHY|nr:hypothetical protein L227DRAFT_558437 [Lentinus tigrinus ALCF2SS1-6]RPD71237.1 hypothetical protein L226DRAFT_615541 [Lentinus tigrinus ALCF2SS1-7]
MSSRSETLLCYDTSAAMSLLPGFPSPSSASAGLGGTEAFYVLVVDTMSQAPQLLNVLLSSIFFGVATSLALANAYILLGKGLRARGPLLLFFATMVLYLSTALFCIAGYVATFAIQAEKIATANAAFAQSEAVFNPLRTASFVSRMSCIQTTALTTNIIVGDAVVWWRASMIWRGRSQSAILCVSVVLLLSTFALSVVDSCNACLLVKNSEGELGRLFAGSRFGTSASIMSLTTNVVATSLTGYKAWVHGRSLKQYLSEGSTMTNVERVLILLTESGLAYGAIWVFVVAYQVGETNLEIYSSGASKVSYWLVAGYFVDGALVPLIAIYPMFIIVVVVLKKSQMDSFPLNSQTALSDTRMTQLRRPISVHVETRSTQHTSTGTVPVGRGRRASHAVVHLRQLGQESLRSGSEDTEMLQGLHESKEM